MESPPHGGSSNSMRPTEAHRRERERALTGLPPETLVRLLVKQERKASEARELVRGALAQLDADARRQARAEAERQEGEARRAREGLRVAQTVRDAQEAAARATQEVELYRLRLQNADREVQRAKVVVSAVEAEREEADIAAGRARTLARRLKEEKVVFMAREAGRREGFELGLNEGRLSVQAHAQLRASEPKLIGNGDAFIESYYDGDTHYDSGEGTRRTRSYAATADRRRTPRQRHGSLDSSATHDRPPSNPRGILPQTAPPPRRSRSDNPAALTTPSPLRGSAPDSPPALHVPPPRGGRDSQPAPPISRDFALAPGRYTPPAPDQRARADRERRPESARERDMPSVSAPALPPQHAPPAEPHMPEPDSEYHRYSMPVATTMPVPTAPLEYLPMPPPPPMPVTIVEPEPVLPLSPPTPPAPQRESTPPPAIEPQTGYRFDAQPRQPQPYYYRDPSPPTPQPAPVVPPPGQVDPPVIPQRGAHQHQPRSQSSSQRTTPYYQRPVSPQSPPPSPPSVPQPAPPARNPAPPPQAQYQQYQRQPQAPQRVYANPLPRPSEPTPPPVQQRDYRHQQPPAPQRVYSNPPQTEPTPPPVQQRDYRHQQPQAPQRVYSNARQTGPTPPPGDYRYQHQQPQGSRAPPHHPHPSSPETVSLSSATTGISQLDLVSFPTVSARGSIYARGHEDRVENNRVRELSVIPEDASVRSQSRGGATPAATPPPPSWVINPPVDYSRVNQDARAAHVDAWRRSTSEDPSPPSPPTPSSLTSSYGHRRQPGAPSLDRRESTASSEVHITVEPPSRPESFVAPPHGILSPGFLSPNDLPRATLTLAPEQPVRPRTPSYNAPTQPNSPATTERGLPPGFVPLNITSSPSVGTDSRPLAGRGLGIYGPPAPPPNQSPRPPEQTSTGWGGASPAQRGASQTPSNIYAPPPTRSNSGGWGASPVVPASALPTPATGAGQRDSYAAPPSSQTFGGAPPTPRQGHAAAPTPPGVTYPNPATGTPSAGYTSLAAAPASNFGGFSPNTQHRSPHPGNASLRGGATPTSFGQPLPPGPSFSHSPALGRPADVPGGFGGAGPNRASVGATPGSFPQPLPSGSAFPPASPAVGAVPLGGPVEHTSPFIPPIIPREDPAPTETTRKLAGGGRGKGRKKK